MFFLSTLKQTSSVADLQEEVEDLIQGVTGLFDPLVISYFISALRPEVQREMLRLRRPTTLLETFTLARSCEARVKVRHSDLPVTSSFLQSAINPPKTTPMLSIPGPPSLTTTLTTTSEITPMPLTPKTTAFPAPNPTSTPSPIPPTTAPSPPLPDPVEPLKPSLFSPPLSSTPPPPAPAQQHLLPPPPSQYSQPNPINQSKPLDGPLKPIHIPIIPSDSPFPIFPSDPPSLSPSPKPPPHPPDPNLNDMREDESGLKPNLNLKTDVELERMSSRSASPAAARRRGSASLLKQRYVLYSGSQSMKGEHVYVVTWVKHSNGAGQVIKAGLGKKWRIWDPGLTFECKECKSVDSEVWAMPLCRVYLLAAVGVVKDNRFVNNLIRDDIDPTPSIYNSLLWDFSRSMKMEVVNRVTEGMKMQGLENDIVMSKELWSSRVRRSDHASKLVVDVQRNDIHSDHWVETALIAYVTSGKLTAVNRDAQGRKKLNGFQRIGDAERVFDEMPHKANVFFSSRKSVKFIGETSYKFQGVVEAVKMLRNGIAVGPIRVGDAEVTFNIRTCYMVVIAKALAHEDLDTSDRICVPKNHYEGVLQWADIGAMVDAESQETVSKAVELLPGLWKQAGHNHEALYCYKCALICYWHLGVECCIRIQKKFVVLLLYGGTVEVAPPSLIVQTGGAFVPKNNLEEAMLLLITLLRKWYHGKIQWDPLVMKHFTFTLFLAGQTSVLARQFEEILIGMYPRSDRWFSLALCDYRADPNEAITHERRNPDLHCALGFENAEQYNFNEGETGVLALFQELGTDMNLCALVFGEYVLNDTMAISVFKAMSSVRSHASSGQSLFMVIFSFLEIFVASMRVDEVEPDPCVFEKFLGTIQMFLTVVILFPHGYFAEEVEIGLEGEWQGIMAELMTMKNMDYLVTNTIQGITGDHGTESKGWKGQEEFNDVYGRDDEFFNMVPKLVLAVFFLLLCRVQEGVESKNSSVFLDAWDPYLPTFQEHINFPSLLMIEEKCKNSGNATSQFKRVEDSYSVWFFTATFNMDPIGCIAYFEADREIEAVSTWETFESFCTQYPNCHLEDKVNLKSEGIDTTLPVNLVHFGLKRRNGLKDNLLG